MHLGPFRTDSDVPCAPGEVHEVFAYPFAIAPASPDFPATYLREVAQLARTALPIDVALRAAETLVPAGEPGDVAFLGTRMSDLIACAADYSPRLLLTAGGLRYALRNRVPFVSAHRTHRDVYRLFQRDPKLETREAGRLIARTVRRIRKATRKHLIVDNDSLFRHRFMVFCAREAGLKTICVQDGLFQSTNDPDFWHGHFADVMCVWGSQQADAYERAGIGGSRLRVLGYPYDPVAARTPPAQPEAVCLLGQPWEKHSKALGERKRSIFEQAAASLRREGRQVFFKPHPRETDAAFFPRGAELATGDMQAALRQFGVFVSLTSTALLEASLCGRTAVQLFDPGFNADRFDRMGYAYCLDATDAPRLGDFLEATAGPWRVPPEVIRTEPHLKDRLREVLDSI